MQVAKSQVNLLQQVPLESQKLQALRVLLGPTRFGKAQLATNENHGRTFGFVLE